MLATRGVAFEQRAALIGINVHPAARSATDSENMNRVVRSSRSCGYRAITAITRAFIVTSMMITELITIGFMSLYSHGCTGILRSNKFALCYLVHNYIFRFRI